MLKVTIEATSMDGLEQAEMLRDHICYHIDNELMCELEGSEWSGHSGGDDAYFGLEDSIIQVRVVK